MTVWAFRVVEKRICGPRNPKPDTLGVCTECPGRAHSGMLESRRAIYFQLTGLAVVIIGIALLSHFFPVITFIAELQRRVTGMGKSGAVVYPLLFAACNVLLLPGGILSIGAGFFFGLWWGFFIVLLGQQYRVQRFRSR